MKKRIIFLIPVVFALGACDAFGFAGDGKELNNDEAIEIGNNIVKNLKMPSDYEFEYSEKNYEDGEIYTDEKAVYKVNRDGEQYLIDEYFDDNNISEYYLVNNSEYGQVYYETAKEDGEYYRQSAYTKSDFGEYFDTVSSFPNWMENLAEDLMDFAGVSKEQMSSLVDYYDSKGYTVDVTYYSKNSSSLKIKTITKVKNKAGKNDYELDIAEEIVTYENNRFVSFTSKNTYINGDVKDISCKATYPNSKIAITLPSDWSSHTVSVTEWILGRF